MRRFILVSFGGATVAAVFLGTGASVDAQRVGVGRTVAGQCWRTPRCVVETRRAESARASVADLSGGPIGSS